MRANEITKLFESPEDGTFAGVRFDNVSIQALKTFSDQHDIPNQTPIEEYHSTLLFSHTPIPDYEPWGSYKQALTAIPKDVKLWGDDEEKALVVILDSPGLVKRHQYLMDKHPEATWDHDEFIPHVTLSYDSGNFDISKLDVSEIGPLQFIEEYAADIEEDWEKNL